MLKNDREIALKIQDLDTPCLILNKDKVLQNIKTMQERMARLGVTLRPHGKTAKCIEVIYLLDQQHRQSITASTLREAEYFFAQGINDILLAVGITPSKLPRIAELINKGAHVSIILDSLEQAEFVSAFATKNQITLPVLIEIDCDGERAGIKPDSAELLQIGKALSVAKNVNLRGIMTHAGGSYHCQTAQQHIHMAEQERLAAVNSADRLKSCGIECDVISVGSTPTAMFAEDLTGVTEVRAGVFMFQDLVMAGLGVCQLNDIGLSVLTRVMGRNAEKDWLLIDAGWMALSSDRGTSAQIIDYRYGAVLDEQFNPIHGMKVNKTNQEHGIIECQSLDNPNLAQLPIGTLLQVLPNHACATAAMHQNYFVTEDGITVSDVWQRVNGW